MKNYIVQTAFLIAAILVFTTSGCNTNPPVSTGITDLTFGKILITSNVDGAEIFVDNQSTGKFTPDTIEVRTGLRDVKIIKFGTVLLEDFANVSCVPCVTSNKITHSLSVSYGAKLNIVKFPTNFPKPTDLFYLAAKSDCDARMAYYNIITAPTIIINGIAKPTPSDSVQIKNAIDDALIQTAPYIVQSSEVQVNKDQLSEINLDLQQNPLNIFNISVLANMDGGNIYITSTVTPLNTSGINLNDYILYTAVVEKRIDTGTPPGSNGETVFYDVLRKMLPTSSGGELAPGNLTQAVEYDYQTQINPAWNAGELITIVYLQDKNTNKIIQAASSE